MFITLEGPEGAGKTTILDGLRRELESRGRLVVPTREPGAGAFGTAIRQILLDGGEVAPTAELFLFLADRAQHVETLIRPSLEAGMVVLSDRYADSTVVYQGHARGMDLPLLRDLNRLATGGLQPDLTLLLDLDVSVGLARLTSRDRLAAEPAEFHLRVRAGFLAEAEREPERWAVIDAAAPAELVLERALVEVLKRCA
ncbi:MAG: dTMP kinase [Fimbriimonadaceae bacterium]|nr:dTMP kinase [Fimbriimonadaceae bacterium]